MNRILIVKPSALGDIVHSMPFLYAVKNKFPWARIDWVVAHGLHTFLEGAPHDQPVMGDQERSVEKDRPFQADNKRDKPLEKGSGATAL